MERRNGASRRANAAERRFAPSQPRNGASRRANGAKRRSGRKPGARATNFALAEFKVVAHGS